MFPKLRGCCWRKWHGSTFQLELDDRSKVERRDRFRALRLHLDLNIWSHFSGDAGRKALVHAAKIENFPITLVESLATGKPILAAPVGGIPEVFRDGIDGFFWPLDDPDEGAATLIRLMEDSGLRERMSASAFDRYQAEFSRERIKKSLLAFVTGIQ